jgi:acetyl-CoA carboxylase carboxyl transferase subunit beta
VPIRDFFRRERPDDTQSPPSGAPEGAADADAAREQAAVAPPPSRFRLRDLSHVFDRSDRSGRAEIPADLWVRCGNDRCRELIYVREFENNLRVCQKCGHHARLAARERIAQLLDPDTFVEEDAGLRPGDPLGFVAAGQAYRAKLADTQGKTGLREAVICGAGRMEGVPIRVVVADFSFMGASMGSVVGEKVARAVERSIEDRLPLLAVCSSGGARMHEGIFSLMQMAKTSAALARLDAARVPFFTLLTDPTTGGVTASFAGLGDVMIAEPGALVGFAGPRVIEQITKQKPPPGTQRAEFQLEHGMIDMVVHRRDLRPTIARLLRLYGGAAARGATGRGDARAAAVGAGAAGGRANGAAGLAKGG